MDTTAGDVTVTETREEPTGLADEVSQGHTSTVPPEEIEKIVNARVQSLLPELKAQLEQRIESRAQSLSQKAFNRAQRQFAQDKEVILRMAKRKGWDASETEEALDEAWKEAHSDVATQEEGAPTWSAPPAPIPAERSAGYSAPPRQPPEGDELNALVQFVRSEYEVEVEPDELQRFVGIRDPNDPRVGEFKTWAKGKLKEQALREAQRQRNAESVRETRDTYGPLSGLSSGRQPEPANPIADYTDPAALYALHLQETDRRARRS